MNGDRGWEFHPEQFRAVYDAWKGTNPTAHELTQVADCLLDVIEAPWERGEPDPEFEDTWVARASETDIILVYEERDGQLWPFHLGEPNRVYHLPIENDSGG